MTSFHLLILQTGNFPSSHVSTATKEPRHPQDAVILVIEFHRLAGLVWEVSDYIICPSPWGPEVPYIYMYHILIRCKVSFQVVAGSLSLQILLERHTSHWQHTVPKRIICFLYWNPSWPNSTEPYKNVDVQPVLGKAVCLRPTVLGGSFVWTYETNWRWNIMKSRPILDTWSGLMLLVTYDECVRAMPRPISFHIISS